VCLHKISDVCEKQVTKVLVVMAITNYLISLCNIIHNIPVVHGTKLNNRIKHPDKQLAVFNIQQCIPYDTAVEMYTTHCN
jgi:hypothetical protein